VTAGRKSWTFGKWLGLGVLLLAISLMLWLANSLRTRGDDDEVLRSGPVVAIQDKAEFLAFLPVPARDRTALIFICGSAVAAEAYTELLRPVAEAGFAVFIVRLPYRFAPLHSHRQIVFDRVRRVIDAYPDVANWVVSGHSLGGALAAGLAAAGTDPLSGLALIATTHPRVDDLSQLRYPVTVIYATRDGIANAGKVRANRVRLPQHTQWVEIAGGNHAQFGRYGEQAFDGDATISREAQEALTRLAVIRLLDEVDTFRAGDVRPNMAATDCPDRSVVFIAHRGMVAEGYPENTLVAFRHAIENGADAIEIDLRGTKDGEVVVIHDETVGRTTNGEGAVADMSLAELRKLDAGRGERIPTYEEVLKFVSGTGVKLLLDIKESQVLDGRKVVRLAEEHGAVLNVIVGPRTLKDLRAFRALNSRLRTLGFIKDVEDIEPFAKMGADIIRLWPKWIDANPGLVDKVHRLGKSVWATTGDASHDELEKLIKLGVNGIISDRPELIGELRASRDKCQGPSGVTP